MATHNAPSQPKSRKGNSWRWIALLLATALIAYLALQNWLPDFFATDNGPTTAIGKQQAQTKALLQAYLVASPHQVRLVDEKRVVGIDLYRVENRLYPQEFMVLEGVPTGLAEQLLSENIKTPVAQSLLNQVTQIQASQTDLPNIQIQSITLQPASTVTLNGQTLPYVSGQVTAMVGQRQAPVTLSGGAVRVPIAKGKERLVVSFSRNQNVYRTDKLAQFYQAVFTAKSRSQSAQ